ncbi:hypothetical protein EF910_05475 [Streptomyces sp. WAC07149]|uniref:hypothetical protein n=1 Tax=Streptomyces sp. WAC07149 TaxID=2487425 RepID=UPI000F7A5839|nr:hypothetical protein [Streptomyces sp. WAC07149]RST07887.1 hypothetical protein EF910_05475 [Streptomyces sp. WAC07149]
MTNHTEFAAWVEKTAVKAGFDVDIPRSGAIGVLGAEIGTTYSTVVRVLAGERVPAYRFWPAWSEALKVPMESFRLEARKALLGEGRS